jgi:hypothetical protein
MFPSAPVSMRPATALPDARNLGATMLVAELRAPTIPSQPALCHRGPLR